MLDPGTTISHYRLLSLIGSGGMGEVYLAEDVSLGRRVALKLLSGELTKDADRVRRFEQEARAISALNHPNIITIFEIGRTDDVHFIATEFVEGDTLRKHLLTRLTFQDVLEMAVQVAGAISAAHEAGVLHRDIKPENIMIRPDGYVKVLDFGLAKLTERDGPTTGEHAVTQPLLETEPGVVMGTVTYMSPEQGRGLKVDSRTDIFSFGTVLYEMIGGRVPFDGTTPSDVIAAILEREPLPLIRLAPTLPSELERIVYKALRKNKEERYQTVKDLLIDLRTFRQELEFSAKIERSVRSGPNSGAAAGSGETVQMTAPVVQAIDLNRPSSSAEYLISEIKRHKKGTAIVLASLLIAAVGLTYFASGNKPGDSLAVLPFINTSADHETDFLIDNITDRLINTLSQLPKLKVISHSAVFRYKSEPADPRSVGNALSVRFVLTGRVTRREDDVLLSVELVDARDNSRIWGEQYSRKLADVFLIQEEIAGTISERLKLPVTAEEKKRLEAYQLYSRGRYYWNRRTIDALKKGIEFFDKAIEKDPGYVLAYAGVADSYNMLAVYSALPPKEAFPKAKDAAMKALEVNEGAAEAHTSLGFVAERYDWDWQAAEAEYRRALELKPDYATGHHRYGVFLNGLGRFGEAISELKRARQLDPLSMIINSDLSRPYYYARRYEESIEYCRKAVGMDPNFGPAHRYLGLTLMQKKQKEEAIAEMQRAVSISTGSTLMKAELGYVYAVSGKEREAQKILDDLIELSKQSYVPSYYPAMIYAGLGQKDPAFQWLEKAFEERSSSLAFLAVDPMMDSLRSDPRFADLARRVGVNSVTR